jgi:hypothetical protein
VNESNPLLAKEDQCTQRFQRSKTLLDFRLQPTMHSLDPPPSAEVDPKATELLRLWAANGKLDVVMNIGSYEEQGYDEAKAWGIIISDFTRHVARALAQRYGKNEEQEMAKIRDSFLREITGPTSPIEGK